MDTKTILTVVQIVVCTALIVSILLQNRAEGLGRMFGGGGEVFRTRRGVEKFLLYSTVVLSVAFCVLSFTLVKLS